MGKIKIKGQFNDKNLYQGQIWEISEQFKNLPIFRFFIVFEIVKSCKSINFII